MQTEVAIPITADDVFGAIVLEAAAANAVVVVEGPSDHLVLGRFLGADVAIISAGGKVNADIVAARIRAAELSRALVLVDRDYEDGPGCGGWPRMMTAARDLDGEVLGVATVLCALALYVSETAPDTLRSAVASPCAVYEAVRRAGLRLGRPLRIQALIDQAVLAQVETMGVAAVVNAAVKRSIIAEPSGEELLAEAQALLASPDTTLASYRGHDLHRVVHARYRDSFRRVEQVQAYARAVMRVQDFSSMATAQAMTAWASGFMKIDDWLRDDIAV